jgi:hypothetical protein
MSNFKEKILSLKNKLGHIAINIDDFPDAGYQGGKR